MVPGTRVNSGGGEKGSESQYILKAKPTGFSDRLCAGCERKIRIKDDSKTLGVQN